MQILLLLVFLVFAILFMLTQQRTLDAIQLENRTTSPGSVWMQLIPIFGFVWQFIVIIRIADSIRNEITARQDDSILGVADAAAVSQLNKRPTMIIGLSYCILTSLSILLSVLMGIIMSANNNTDDIQPATTEIFGLLVSLFMLASIICWIIYWVQMSIWKRKILKIRI